jgi:hypothetical protein
MLFGFAVLSICAALSLIWMLFDTLKAAIQEKDKAGCFFFILLLSIFIVFVGMAGWNLTK